MNWTQLKMVLWLRWRLTRNQFARKGKVNAVIAVVAIVLGLCVAVGAGIGGIFGGMFALANATPRHAMLTWDSIVCIFLFMWLIGVLTELQRSETIDLARLLHLPVTLEGVFFINYIVSHLTMSIIFFVPVMLGLCIGLVLGKGLTMLLMFPLVLTFVFMVTALTYCLRGWLIALMVNPRRRRNIMVFITLFVILLGQAPNLYFNVYLRHRGNQGHKSQGLQKAQPDAIPEGFVNAHAYVPFLWLPKGAMELTDGNVMPAVAGSLGAFLLGSFGLAWAYRSTMRFYTGKEKAKAIPVRQVVVNGKPGVVPKNFIEKQVPFVSEDVAALTLAFFRSMIRAPEIRIALFTNFVIIIVLVAWAFSNSLKNVPERFMIFSGTAGVAFTFFGLIQMMFNQFGMDREGFRALVLSPMSRRDVLLAKNLSFAPFIFTLGMTMLIILHFVLKMPALAVLAGVFQLGVMFLLLSLAGNFVSALVPYRITAGSLKPTKPPPKVILLMLLTQLLFPVVMVPVAFPPVIGILSENFGFSAASVDAACSLLLLGVAVFLYKAMLNTLGNFLEEREQKILMVVAQEGE
jgi:hypothetical protein